MKATCRACRDTGILQTKHIDASWAENERITCGFCKRAASLCGFCGHEPDRHTNWAGEQGYIDAEADVGEDDAGPYGCLDCPCTALVDPTRDGRTTVTGWRNEPCLNFTARAWSPSADVPEDGRCVNCGHLEAAHPGRSPE